MSGGAEQCSKCTQLQHTQAVATAALESFPIDAVVVLTGQGEIEHWNIEAVVMGASPTGLMRLMAAALRKTADAVERAARQHEAEHKKQVPS